MFKLLIATTNNGKLEEIRALFEKHSIEAKLYNLKDFDITVNSPETSETFAGNAEQKALFYSRMVPDVYVAADDSGLAVDALDGKPGVHSARYSGPDATDDSNTAKLLNTMKNISNRNARFITAVCLVKNGDVIETFNGEVKGTIIHEKKGSHGFGYDPVFYYAPFEKTFAELTKEEKNGISHRSKAFNQLIEFVLALQKV